MTQLKGLIKTVELPTSLKACGVEEKDLEAIAERAVWNVSLEANPRPLNYDVFPGYTKEGLSRDGRSFVCYHLKSIPICRVVRLI